MNDPDFVRERAAWFSFGVITSASYSAITIFAVAALVGLVSLFVEVDVSQALTVQVACSCAAIALESVLFEASARDRARRGGVHVERY